MEDSVLSPGMAWALLRDGRVQLIDLRARDELDLPRIPGARMIPLDALPSELSTLDRERPIMLLSVTGRKAAGAMKAMRAAGLTACAVEGGIRAWLRAGLPTDAAPRVT